jgi:hypothetical protein
MRYTFDQRVFMKHTYMKRGCVGKEGTGVHFGCYGFKQNIYTIIQGGSNMTGTNCDLFTHILSRSYLNHLVYK